MRTASARPPNHMPNYIARLLWGGRAMADDII